MSFSPSKYPRDYFALYAEACFANFGDRVKHWMTINEPLQTAFNGYGIGVFAPGGCEGETARCYLAAHHQILAHAAAVDVYRRKFKVRFTLLGCRSWSWPVFLKELVLGCTNHQSIWFFFYSPSLSCLNANFLVRTELEVWDRVQFILFPPVL